MKILGLIPARGGSVRIPKKNIARLGHMPLIGWTITEAKLVHHLAQIWVSTDDAEIANVAHSFSGITVIDRPDYLSQGENGSSYRTITHALSVAERAGNEFDAVMLLQPTSPFRRWWDIAKAADMLLSGNSVVSVRKSNGQVNGAIYLTTTAKLETGVIYDDTSQRMLMADNRSIDIDTPEDLETARMWIADGNR